MGAAARCAGKECLIGNLRLMREHGVETADAERDAARLSDEGKTVLYFAQNGKLAALFAVADVIKEGSAEAVAGLKERGVTPVMLTGDSAGAARAVARQAGIERVISEVLPQDKLDAVIESKKTAVTAMVGDGINDAPALKEAERHGRGDRLGRRRARGGRSACRECGDRPEPSDGAQYPPEPVLGVYL